MIFQQVLDYYEITIDKIDVMYICLPASIEGKPFVSYTENYFHENFEEIFNEKIKLNVPIMFDFLLKDHDEYLGEASLNDVHILYKDDGTPYISCNEYDYFSDENNYDSYNKNLIAIYKIMKNI